MTGFYLAKGVHYWFSRWPARLYRFADRCNIGVKWMTVCKGSAAVLIILFITDIHRYGAWYSGGATYIMPWWQLVYILLWTPIVLAILKCFFHFLLKNESLLVWIPMGAVIMYGAIFLIVSAACVINDGFRIMHGYIYLTSWEMEEIFNVTTILSILIVVLTVFQLIRDAVGRGIDALSTRCVDSVRR